MSLIDWRRPDKTFVQHFVFLLVDENPEGLLDRTPRNKRTSFSKFRPELDSLSIDVQLRQW